MVGIYRLYNVITGQSYIGQSKDLAKRLEEHFYHRSAANGSEIDNAIGYYGIQNFMFQILYICDPRDLDWLEDYFITLFQSNIYGYNILRGGQKNDHELNPNSKLTSYEVYNIREAYNNHEDPEQIFNSYFKGRISISSFFSAWEGSTWKGIHMDAYTKENKEYYKSLLNSPDNKKIRTNFTDEEVMEFRQRYVNESVEEIYNSVAPNCKFNTFKGIVSGDSYKHLPVYLKSKKIWINK